MAVALQSFAPHHGEEEEDRRCYGSTYEKEVASAFFQPPTLSLAQIRSAIPEKCWKKDSLRSIAYLLRDIAIVSLLAASAHFFADMHPWLLWPLYWLMQGTMFWALFVLGHDW